MGSSQRLPGILAWRFLSREQCTLASPRIAVILPVYNGEQYVAEAIRSVLDQTYADFRLFVVDDGSIDRSFEIVEAFADPRVRLIRFHANRGVVAALNAGIAQSDSEFVARMDADDICLPRRFERQVALLDAHPNVVMCGTWTRQFGDDTAVRRPPADPRQVRARLFFGFAIGHPTIMTRRAFLERHGLQYREECRHVEDFDLFFRAAALGDLANVPEILLRNRAHAGEVTVVHQQEQVRTETRLRIEQLGLLMPDLTEEDGVFHVAVLDGAIAASDLPRAEQWLVRLGDANRTRQLYDTAAFQRELRWLFQRLHVATGALGIRDIAFGWGSPLAEGYRDRLADAAGLLARAAARPVRRIWRVARRSLAQQDGSKRRLPV
ncbi:MAG: glycosyltransferase family 2 protein [Vicinamibacterales bacterium]|nr:glycosyltransferase family 2 protein [Vicinamibacterales bacterium]